MGFAVGVGTGGSDERPAKRAWRPWYKLPDPQSAICPSCNVPCTVDSTQKSGATLVQYRSCPRCGHKAQTLAR